MKISGRGRSRKKIDIMKLFKFNIAFENEISDGYVTEKILHSLYANTIPIYFGELVMLKMTLMIKHLFTLMISKVMKN